MDRYSPGQSRPLPLFTADYSQTALRRHGKSRSGRKLIVGATYAIDIPGFIACAAARVHFGIYAESVKHIHVHVFPRMPDMPAGNIPNLWIEAWMNILHSLGLKKAYADEVVAQYAEKLGKTYLKLANAQLEQA